MWEIFNPILSWLRDLLDNRLTTARSENLDNLDAAVSTRAAASTALSTAVWDAAKAARLANAAAEDTPLLDVPLGSGIVGSAARVGQSFNSTPGVKSTQVNATAYTTIDSYTGQGVLCLAILQKTDAGTNTLTLRVTLDGVVIDTQTTLTNQYSAVCPVGILAGGMTPILEAIPFKTSLLIEAKADVTGAVGSCHTRFRKTA